MTFSPDCREKISQRGAGSFAPSTGPGTPFFPEREVSLMSNTSSAEGNPASKRMTNPNYKAKRARDKAYGASGRLSTSANASAPVIKCQRSACVYDAIGYVESDPYDHVSWSPLLTSRVYCLNCYNERVLAAFDFIRREK